jgi:hypothetical protein
MFVNPLLNRSSISTTVCSKSVIALLKTELCDKVLNQSASCEAFDLGSPVLIPDPWFLLRKEVIQPQVPLRLPCYDFIPITSHTFGTF